jgi:hypothetical protein
LGLPNSSFDLKNKIYYKFMDEIFHNFELDLWVQAPLLSLLILMIPSLSKITVFILDGIGVPLDLGDICNNLI